MPTDREVMEQMAAAFGSLLGVAKFLQVNSVACVAKHHHHDILNNGLPPWLRDTQQIIDEAFTIYRTHKANSNDA